MIGLINSWGWAVLAVVLAGAEIIAPGVFLIWLAAAAAATAVFAAVFELAWEVQVVLYAAFSVLAVVIGRAFFGENSSEAADPALNRLAERLIGIKVTVTEPLRNGRGRVRVGDSEWLAEGPDLPAGACVRIIAVEGATLLVEPD